MGYDCTLHAVDEKQISQAIAELLEEDRAKKEPADEDEKQELWDQVVTSLAEEPVSESASLVCQMALVLASKTQPYHYERGFALCLWPEQTRAVKARLPEELTDSPEILFGRLLEKYPQLHGQFPRKFSGNWSTGTFISAKKAPEALGWITNKVAEFAEGDRRLFRGLLLVLEHCARHKLAYWEGTDLPVPMAEVAPEGAERRRASRAFKWPDTGYLPLASRGNLFVCEYHLGPDKCARTALADFSVWPPSIAWLPEFATCASFSPAGKLVTVASEPDKYFYTVRLRSNATPEADVQELAVPNPETVGENGYDWCGFLGEQVVSLLKFQKGKTPSRYPLFQQGILLLEDKTFRPAKDRHKGHSLLSSLLRRRHVWDDESVRAGMAKLGCGGEVFIWDEKGYERSGNGFKATFDIGPNLTQTSGWMSVAAGEDGFFCISQDYDPMESQRPALYEIRRGGTPVAHLTQITNVMEIRPGPSGSLLLREGDNKAGDWGKIYWPTSKQLVRLKPDLLPDVEPDSLRQFHWLQEKRILLAFTPEEVWPIPWEQIEKLPRSKVR
jgi:hypothetical protein